MTRAGVIAFAAVLVCIVVAVVLVLQNMVLVDELRSTFPEFMLVHASSSDAESERTNDEIVTFDNDCQEGYEFDSSGSTCVPIENDEVEEQENKTGFTKTQKFGLIMNMIKAIPWMCETDFDESSKDNAELWKEACYLYQKYYN